MPECPSRELFHNHTEYTINNHVHLVEGYWQVVTYLWTILPLLPGGDHL
jgi:hypothetical protein